MRLSPCPFCGSTHLEFDGTAVTCMNDDCLTTGPVRMNDIVSAEDAWNDRDIDIAARNAIEGARG